MYTGLENMTGKGKLNKLIVIILRRGDFGKEGV